MESHCDLDHAGDAEKVGGPRTLSDARETPASPGFLLLRVRGAGDTIDPAQNSMYCVERICRNLGYFLLVRPLILLSGFWIPYFSLIPHFDPAFTTAADINAGQLCAGVGLIGVEPLAIRNKAISVHRVLGNASYALMPLIVVSQSARFSTNMRKMWRAECMLPLQ